MCIYIYPCYGGERACGRVAKTFRGTGYEKKKESGEILYEYIQIYF